MIKILVLEPEEDAKTIGGLKLRRNYEDVTTADYILADNDQEAQDTFVVLKSRDGKADVCVDKDLMWDVITGNV